MAARATDGARPEQALVVFLRAVNVGSHNRIPLKEFAGTLGAHLGTTVGNYLQSGNLIVRADDPVALGVSVHDQLSEHYGLSVQLVVRSAAELAALLAANPWPDEDPLRVHLAMWAESHEQAAAQTFARADWGGDEVVFDGSNAWLRYDGASHTSKLNVQALDRRLRVTATARNLRTIRAVAELAAHADALDA